MLAPSMERRSSAAWLERAFAAACAFAALLPIALVVALVGRVMVDGVGRLDLEFLRGYPGRDAHRAGILPALVGSVYLIGLTALLAVPVGVGAAIYLEEYEQESRLARWIEMNIANLANIPSVIYGLLGLGSFVRALGFGRSLLSGAATLALLVLPLVILSAREALRRVPRSLREACLALGATRWQALRRVVLPAALPRMLSGATFALTRAMGDAAPLVVLGAVTYVSFLPDGLGAPFTALPLQILDWLSRPKREFLVNASAASVVLLVTLLLLNLLAFAIERSFGRRSS